MSWFDTVLNIGSTIGKVCGALQGNSNSAAHLGMAGNINEKLGGLVFYNDPNVAGNPLTAANQSSEELPIVIDFLNNSLVGTQPQQITIPYFSKIQIGPAFQTASSGGDETFTAAFTTGTAASEKNSKSNTSSVTVRAASNTLLTVNNTIQVGSYFTATLSTSAISIGILGGYTLAGVVMLSVRGASGNLAQTIPTAGNVAGSDGTIDINVPFGIDTADGIPFIEIIGLINTTSARNDINIGYRHQHEKLGDADKIHLKKLLAAW